jgi:hypothetical protein
MSPLRNPAIERPQVLFEVELVVFGTLISSASRCSVSVLAETARGARRICLSHYRRAEVKRTREVRTAS